MSNSPNIILKLKFNLSLNSKDNKNTNKNYQKNRENDINNMFDYFSNPKESAVGMFDYYAGILSGKKYNLVLENGKYATKKEIKNLKNNYKNYIKNSHLWKGIISFNNPYIYENISLKDLEQKFAKEVMPQFFKYCGFNNPRDMGFVFAIHTKSKSKHIHIHFAFIEKKPNYRCRDNKIKYRSKAMISEDEKNYLKRLMALTIERERYYTPLLTKTNTDIDDLKKYFNLNEKNFILDNSNEIFLEEKILRLGSLVKEYREINDSLGKKVKYNSLNNSELGKEIRALTKDIKNYLFNDKESLLYDKKKEIDKDLEDINMYFQNINERLNIKEEISKNDLVRNKKEYIDNYVLNAIVNQSLYKYNKVYSTVKSQSKYDKITLEDLIQELAYENREKTKISNEVRRRNVLLNYFNGSDIKNKFPSKYKMESALRKINYEMDKSAEKFSELFNYNDKYR